MNNFFALLKVDILGLFGFNKVIHKSNENGKLKASFGIVGLLSVGLIFMVLSAVYTLALCFILKEENAVGNTVVSPSVVLDVFYAFSAIIVLISGLYNAKGNLFAGKDYNMTAALPIKSSVIVCEKLVFSYVYNSMIFFIVFIPSCISYGIVMGENLPFYLRAIFMMPFAPMLPMIIGVGVGTLVAVLTARFKRANIIQVIVSVALLGCYFAFILVLNSGEGNDQDLFLALAGISKYLPLTNIISAPISNGNLLLYFVGLGVSLISFAAYFMVVGKFYKAINSLVSNRKTTGAYKVNRDSVKEQSVLKALVKKEFRRIFSSSLYMMNCLSGMMMTIIFSIMIIGNGVPSAQAFGDMADVIMPILGALAIVVPIIGDGMPLISVVSISAEGQNLWILKSSPVDEMDVFKAKIITNLIAMLPLSLICQLIIIFFYKVWWLVAIFGIVLTVSYCVAMSIVGLMLGLKFPQLKWDNEAQFLKRGTGVMIASFMGLLLMIPIIMIISVLTFLLGNLGAIIAFVLLTALCILTCWLGLKWLSARGRVVFKSLES